MVTHSPSVCLYFSMTVLLCFSKYRVTCSPVLIWSEHRLSLPKHGYWAITDAAKVHSSCNSTLHMFTNKWCRCYHTTRSRPQWPSNWQEVQRWFLVVLEECRIANIMCKYCKCWVADCFASAEKDLVCCGWIGIELLTCAGHVLCACPGHVPVIVISLYGFSHDL